MKNIISSSRLAETGTAIFIQAEKNISLDEISEPDTQTVAYIQEHDYDSLDDFHTALDQASDQASASRKSLKDTEQQLRNVNEQIHSTGQYLAYKNVYADYRKSRNKDKFYEEHRAELSLYDTALRTLKEKSVGNKLPSMKALYAEKDRLIELRDMQREDFSNRRNYEREFRTVSANIDMILGKSHEQELPQKFYDL